MGLLCEYFEARSDAEAAATIDWVGGPAQPEAKRSLLRRTKSSTPGFEVVDLGGVEPTVQMGTLEEILTGRSFEDILDDTDDAIVADRDGGERLVVRLTPGLQVALATATDSRLREAAVPWSETEEFGGLGDPEDLAEGLTELAALARRASANGSRLYCWVCV